MGPGLSLNRDLLNSSTDSESPGEKMKPNIESTYHDPEELDFLFPEETLYDLQNGLNLRGIYLPEEVLILILSYVPSNDILKLRLVCKNWYNFSKTHILWSMKYSRIYGKAPKLLPWYTFYALFSLKVLDQNILLNKCGKEKYKHWIITENGGHKFKIETVPQGCDKFPDNLPDFKNISGCFVTSFGTCKKHQDIPLTGNLIKYIMNKHKPHIYVSEWVAGRFDCGGSYWLGAYLYYIRDERIPTLNDYITNFEFLKSEKINFKYLANETTAWKKIELLLKDYPDKVEGIRFAHSGIDNKFWAGHYGPKMTAGTVRILFDSMEPICESTSNEMDQSN